MKKNKPNIKFAIFLLTSLLLIASCTNRGNNPVRATQESIDEDFYTFFKKFVTDSLFQVSRIEFPLEMSVLDDYQDVMRGAITMEQYRFMTFSPEGSFLVRPETSENEQTVVFRMEETDIRTYFVFKKDNIGKWRLMRYDDRTVWKPVEIDAIIPMKNGEEDFRTFLEKFGTDSLFQVSRIVFPLKGVEFEFDDTASLIPLFDDDGNFIGDSVRTFTIDLERHRFMRGFGGEAPFEDIDTALAFLNAQPDDFFEIIEVREITRVSDDTYFVHFFFLEICGRGGYYFKKDENGKWYLIKIDARST